MPQVDSTAIDISKHTTTKPQINTLNASRLGSASVAHKHLAARKSKETIPRWSSPSGGPHVRPAAHRCRPPPVSHLALGVSSATVISSRLQQRKRTHNNDRVNIHHQQRKRQIKLRPKNIKTRSNQRGHTHSRKRYKIRHLSAKHQSHHKLQPFPPI